MDGGLGRKGEIGEPKRGLHRGRLRYRVGVYLHLLKRRNQWEPTLADTRERRDDQQPHTKVGHMWDCCCQKKGGGNEGACRDHVSPIGWKGFLKNYFREFHEGFSIAKTPNYEGGKSGMRGAKTKGGL